MGYNPHICILCAKIEDNGWSGGEILDPFQRCNIIVERLELKFDPRDVKPSHKFQLALNKEKRCSYDVCDKCFNKGQPIRDPFFNVKRTKSERQEFWLKQIQKKKGY